MFTVGLAFGVGSQLPLRLYLRSEGNGGQRGTLEEGSLGLGGGTRLRVSGVEGMVGVG